MKVKKEIVAGALVKLLTNMTTTMPNSTYKFLMGGMSAFATTRGLDKISAMLDAITDSDGLVDVELLQQMVSNAFNAAGGTLTIDLFDGNGLMSMIVKPLKLNITIADIEPLMQEIKMNAVQEPVSVNLSAATQVEQPKS